MPESKGSLNGKKSPKCFHTQSHGKGKNRETVAKVFGIVANMAFGS